MIHQALKAAALAVVILSAGTFGVSAAHGQAAPAAAAPAANPVPSKLAVINIVQLFDKLDEKASIDGQIDTLKKTWTEKINAKKADVERLQKDLDSGMLKPDSPEFKDRQNELLNKSMDLQVTTQFAQKQLVIELSIQKAKLYKKINDAVASYAQANGIAMVFVTDDPNVGDAQTPEALQAQISLRKVMYADARFDITRGILEKMNNEFRLAGGK